MIYHCKLSVLIVIDFFYYFLHKCLLFILHFIGRIRLSIPCVYSHEKLLWQKFRINSKQVKCKDWDFIKLVINCFDLAVLAVYLCCTQNCESAFLLVIWWHVFRTGLEPWFYQCGRSVQFSSVWLGRRGQHERRFCRDPLPDVSAGGPCKQFWHGQGCQLFDVSHPAFMVDWAFSRQ